MSRPTCFGIKATLFLIISVKKILVIGCPGSGKTTFSTELSQILNLPLVHLDKLYWCGNWEHVPREEFDKRLLIELKKECWLIDGNFNRTIPKRLEHCDTVFYFDFPVFTCLWGVTKRAFQNRGKTRDDMGGNCPEYFDKQKMSLYKDILSFKRRHRQNYYELLVKATHVKVIVFKSRRQVRKYINDIKSHQS